MNEMKWLRLCGSWLFPSFHRIKRQNSRVHNRIEAPSKIIGLSIKPLNRAEKGTRVTWRWAGRCGTATWWRKHNRNLWTFIEDKIQRKKGTDEMRIDKGDCIWPFTSISFHLASIMSVHNIKTMRGHDDPQSASIAFNYTFGIWHIFFANSREGTLSHQIGCENARYHIHTHIVF